MNSWINFHSQSFPALVPLWPIERTADLKITFQQCSEEKPRSQENKKMTAAVDNVPKILDLVHMILYDVLLTSWTFAYESNVFLS